MKVLITADWHLGRNQFRLNFLPYQEQLLMDWLLPRAREADLLVVAGDVFDAKHPSAEALTTFSRFAAALADRGIRAVFLAGNHDLPELVVYMREILQKHRLFSVSSSGWSVDRAVIPDLPGLVFLPHFSRFDLASQEVSTVEDLMARLADRYSPHDHILITHLTIVPGASQNTDSDWEMGLVPTLDAAQLSPWKLVVSGHLHGYHTPGSNVVYPGSLLKYHPREIRQTKTVVWVDTETGDMKAEPVPQILDMVEVKGRVKDGSFELEDAPSPESLEHAQALLVRVWLTHPGTDLRLAGAVEEAVRETLGIETVFFGGVEGVEGESAPRSSAPTRSLEGMSLRELALLFFEEQGVFQSVDRQQVEEILDEALARMEQGGGA